MFSRTLTSRIRDAAKSLATTRNILSSARLPSSSRFTSLRFQSNEASEEKSKKKSVEDGESAEEDQKEREKPEEKEELSEEEEEARQRAARRRKFQNKDEESEEPEDFSQSNERQDMAAKAAILGVVGLTCTLVGITLSDEEFTHKMWEDPSAELLWNKVKSVPREVYDSAALSTEILSRNTSTAYTAARVIADYKILEYKRDWSKWDPETFKQERSKIHSSSAERILELCQRNKGIYVKAGQHLSSLNHALPTEYTSVLRVLQDRAPAHTYEETVRIFEQDFGETPEKFFKEFDREPIASASLAQVHRAVARNGKSVAVKVQHPGLRELFDADLSTMQTLARTASRVFENCNFEWVVPEFRRQLTCELNFENEGLNAERTKRLFRHNPQLAVPRIHWSLTSPRVLTMQYMTGVNVMDTNGLRALGVSPAQVATLLTEVFSEQIFTHGWVHADPHPGNMLIQKPSSSSKPRLVLLDHGLYRDLDDTFRAAYAGFWRSVIFRDMSAAQDYCEKMGVPRQFAKLLAMTLTLQNFDNPHSKRLLDARTKMTRQEIRKSLEEFKDVDVGAFMESLPRQLLLLLRTNNHIRSITKSLGDPINRFSVMARYTAVSEPTPVTTGKKGAAPIAPLSSKLSVWRDSIMLRLRLRFIDFALWWSQYVPQFMLDKLEQEAIESEKL